MQSVLRKLKSPKGGKVPGFYPHLQGMKYGNGLFTYTEETSSDAYNNMVKILGWVVERALELPKNWVNPRSVVQGAYLFREKKFFMNLLKLSLPDDADFECVRGLLEKLSSYEVAIIQLRYVIAARAKNHSDIFLRNVEVQLCNPIVQSFPAPKFKELCKSAMGPEKLSRLEVPDDIIATYEKTRRRVKIQEHCEVQLARFLIENPARTQVVAYFGVSNNSCFLCSRLLEAFRNPHIPGDLHEFAVRGSHGEIYGRWRPILDPAAPDSTVQRFELCHADLLRDVTAQFNDEVDRYLALPIRPRLPEVAR